MMPSKNFRSRTGRILQPEALFLGDVHVHADTVSAPTPTCRAGHPIAVAQPSRWTAREHGRNCGNGPVNPQKVQSTDEIQVLPWYLSRSYPIQPRPSLS
jgi:hypothetical protein